MVCGTVAFGAIVVGTTSASAAGFMLMEQSISGLGNCFAGSGAAAIDASTVYFNPAGMTMLEMVIAARPGPESTECRHFIHYAADMPCGERLGRSQHSANGSYADKVVVSIVVGSGVN